MMNAHTLQNAFVQAWRDIWFQQKPTTPLEIIRIGIGFALLIHYATISSQLLVLYGDDGLLTRQALTGLSSSPLFQSIFYYFDAPWQWVVFHFTFLAACFAFMVGWRTSWLKWLVLIGHLSYIHRNPGISYGVDNILASLLLILCLAPIGHAISLDHCRRRRRAKQKQLDADITPHKSAWGFACTRLIQFQMVVFFFFSATEKLRGDSWWSGDALWIALVNQEYLNIVPLQWFADHYWLVNIMSYGTIVGGLAYCFLIWGQRSRPYMLAEAILLHLGIAVCLGLYTFSFVMIIAHLSFLRHEWLQTWARHWKTRTAGMEMIYDGDCAFCKRSMAWLLAFDGLRQISVRDYRLKPSSVVSNEQLDRALYLTTDDGKTFAGFEAYRYLVLRIPGLWWTIPLFYIPVLSRFVGHPLYNWIATHRHVISTCVVKEPGYSAVE